MVDWDASRTRTLQVRTAAPANKLLCIVYHCMPSLLFLERTVLCQLVDRDSVFHRLRVFHRSVIWHLLVILVIGARVSS